MRLLAVFILLYTAGLVSAEPIIVEGGLSPDGTVAVAVLSDRPGDEVDDYPKEQIAYLVTARSKQIICPLNGTFTGGGTWGRTLSNVRSKWSPDGRFLAINLRIGKMSHTFEVFEISHRHAVLQVLPNSDTHSKGAAYKQLDFANNSGEVVRVWVSNTEFITEQWGLRARNENELNLSKFGLEDFDGSLERVFSFKRSGWILKDIRMPKKVSSPPTSQTPTPPARE